MSTTGEMLSEVPLFESFDDKERAVLAERVDLITLKAGQVLFDYGDPGDYMVIMKSGVVEMTVKTKTGERVFLERAEAGDFFGEISLLDMGARTAEAIVVDREDLDELVRIKPTAAMHLLKATGKRLRATQTILRNTATRNANEEALAKSNIVLRIADWVAAFSGSISFLVLHIFMFGAYIGLNCTSLAFDPFPFNFLTMTVSLEAIILSTLLLFSSNREGAKEKIRSDIEYDVNLKAELQIQHLHEKMDVLKTQLLARLDLMDTHKKPAGPTLPSANAS
jgi:CRP/FNR family cyclic AMP-dependent transcriptional regulator